MQPSCSLLCHHLFVLSTLVSGNTSWSGCCAQLYPWLTSCSADMWSAVVGCILWRWSSGPPAVQPGFYCTAMTWPQQCIWFPCRVGYVREEQFRGCPDVSAAAHGLTGLGHVSQQHPHHCLLLQRWHPDFRFCLAYRASTLPTHSQETLLSHFHWLYCDLHNGSLVLPGRSLHLSGSTVVWLQGVVQVQTVLSVV